MAAASDSFNKCRIILYNPDDQLAARGLQTKEFSAYLNTLVSVCVDALRAIGTPENLDVVVAVRSQRRARAWFVSERPPDDPILQGLKRALESVPAPEITSGSIVFALSGAIGGGKRQYGPQFQLPVPDEWRHAFSDIDGSVSVDELIERVWPARSLRGWRDWFRRFVSGRSAR